MTPRARMAFWAGFLLAAPLSAFADDWQPLYTKSQVYFVNKAAFTALQDKAGKAVDNKSLDLVIEVKKADGSKAMAPSEARLDCVKGAPCQIVADGKGKVPGSYTVAPNVTASRQQAPLVAAAAQPHPGVSDSVWNVIVNSGIDQARWQKAAKALQALAATKPELYARIAAKGRATYDEILKDLDEAISELQPSDKKADEKLAARVAAQALKLPAVAAEPPRVGEPPAATAKPVDDEPGANPEAKKAKSAVGALVKLLESDKTTVRADLAARLAAYLTTPIGEESFIGGEAPKREELAGDIKAGAAAWVAGRVKTPTGRLKAAILYYVMGEEEKPWFKENEGLAELKRDMGVRKDFTNLMRDTFSVGGKKTALPGSPIGGPYKGDKKWIDQALEQAVLFAEKAMNTGGLSNAKLKQSIMQNEGPVTALPGPGQRIGPGGPTGDFSGHVFSFEEMYGEVGLTTKDGRPMGAMVAYLPVPDSKGSKENCSRNEEGYCLRKISMGVSHEACNGATDYDAPCRKLGIFDISSRRGFGQYFNIGTDGDVIFSLDDRTPGGNKYKLTMSGDQVTFQSVDKDGKPVGRPMSATVGELYERQHALVQERGVPVTVGDRTYLTMDRGGFFTTRQFWPVGEDGKLKPCGENPSGCRPQMVSYVAKVAADGTTYFYDKAGIGNVQSAADATKSTAFNLIYDRATGLYTVKEATGDEKLVDRPKELKDMLDPPKPKKKDDKAEKKDDDKEDPKTPGKKDEPTGKANDCSIKELPLTLKTEKYRGKDDGSDFDLFTQKAPKDFSDRNGTYVCVFGNKVLALDGTLIGKGDIKLSGELITIETFNVDSETGKGVFLLPGELKDVVAKKDGWLYKGDTKWREIHANAAGGAGTAAGEKYQISVASLKDSLNGKTLASIGRVASVKLKRAFGPAATDYVPQVVVYYKKGDSYVEKSMKALDEHAKGTICADKRDTIQTHLSNIFKDKKFTDDMARVLATDKTEKAASEGTHVTFTCKALGEVTDNVPVQVVEPSWPGEGLYTKEGVLGTLGANREIIPVK